jgi:hypothetical protein
VATTNNPAGAPMREVHAKLDTLLLFAQRSEAATSNLGDRVGRVEAELHRHRWHISEDQEEIRKTQRMAALAKPLRWPVVIVVFVLMIASAGVALAAQAALFPR